MTFVSTTHPQDGGGNVYRGLVAVDGVSYAIDADNMQKDAKGKAKKPSTQTELGAVAVKPGEEKYVTVQFQSPGQISGGQRLDLTKNGG
jgi:hypothetical protein